MHNQGSFTLADLVYETFDRLYPALPSGFDFGRQRFTGGRDLDVLLRLAASYRPRRILELYTAEGDTSLALARSCPSAAVVTVDIVQELGVGKPTGEVPSRASVGRAFRSLHESQHISSQVIDPREFVWSSLGDFDFVFIDGDHSYEGVVADTLRALRVANPGAVLVWDDYWSPCPDVMRFVDEMNHTENWLVRVEGSRIVFAVLSAVRRSVLWNRTNDIARLASISVFGVG